MCWPTSDARQQIHEMSTINTQHTRERIDSSLLPHNGQTFDIAQRLDRKLLNQESPPYHAPPPPYHESPPPPYHDTRPPPYSRVDPDTRHHHVLTPAPPPHPSSRASRMSATDTRRRHMNDIGHGHYDHHSGDVADPTAGWSILSEFLISCAGLCCVGVLVSVARGRDVNAAIAQTMYPQVLLHPNYGAVGAYREVPLNRQPCEQGRGKGEVYQHLVPSVSPYGGSQIDRQDLPPSMFSYQTCGGTACRHGVPNNARCQLCENGY